MCNQRTKNTKGFLMIYKILSCSLLLVGLFYTEARAISSTHSLENDDLKKLHYQLDPGAARQTAQPAQPMKVAEPGVDKTDINPDIERRKMVEALSTMHADELEKVKNTLIVSAETAGNLTDEEKMKLIEDTTRFYDTLKGMNASERKKFLSSFKE